VVSKRTACNVSGFDPHQGGYHFRHFFFNSAKDIWAIYFEIHPYLRFSFKISFMFKVRVRTAVWLSVSIINWSSERVWTVINDVSDHQWGIRLSTEKYLRRQLFRKATTVYNTKNCVGVIVNREFLARVHVRGVRQWVQVLTACHGCSLARGSS
jgi:hypothetical protein